MRIGPMDGYVLLGQPETATPSNLGSGVFAGQRPGLDDACINMQNARKFMRLYAQC
jgi:hypothetical protein